MPSQRQEDVKLGIRDAHFREYIDEVIIERPEPEEGEEEEERPPPEFKLYQVTMSLAWQESGRERTQELVSVFTVPFEEDKE